MIWDFMGPNSLGVTIRVDLLRYGKELIESLLLKVGLIYFLKQLSNTKHDMSLIVILFFSQWTPRCSEVLSYFGLKSLGFIIMVYNK